MKKLVIKSCLGLAAVLAFGLTGCLKDKDFDNGSIQSNRNAGNEIKVVEIGVQGTSVDSANHGYGSTVYGINASNTDTTFGLIPVVLATSAPADEDVNVTLTPAPELVDSFNNYNGTAFAVPTASMYSIVNPGNVVTIARGTNVGYLRIKINPSVFLGGDWAFGYRIASVDKPGYVISRNNLGGVAVVAIKNKYDGSYRLTLRANGWEAPSIGISGVKGAYPGFYTMETSSVTSVDGNSYRGDYLLPAFTGDLTTLGGPTAFGATTPRFTFDPNTNKLISVTNSTPPDSRNRILTILNTAPDPSLNIFPSGVTINSWDPATGNIYAYFKLSQTGRPDLLYQAIYTYVGPR